eukprot:TRINITY_DN2787_c1_g1_i4.p1 TRINITY_DN2787_c1_g1~~TRINITY_DN2787_c1_g1_i4.p1  ORF type:complete len:497 (+),score=113.78 TRINITY_DN2787_c1_g1_i4:70-1560(+)
MTRPNNVPSLNLAFVKPPPDPRVRLHYENVYRSGPPIPSTPSSTSSSVACTPAPSARVAPNTQSAPQYQPPQRQQSQYRPPSPSPSPSTYAQTNAAPSVSAAPVAKSNADFFYKTSHRAAYTAPSAMPSAKDARSTPNSAHSNPSYPNSAHSNQSNPIHTNPAYLPVRPLSKSEIDAARPSTPSALHHAKIDFNPQTPYSNASEHVLQPSQPQPKARLNAPLKNPSSGFGEPPPVPSRVATAKQSTGSKLHNRSRSGSVKHDGSIKHDGSVKHDGSIKHDGSGCGSVKLGASSEQVDSLGPAIPLQNEQPPLRSVPQRVDYRVQVDSRSPPQREESDKMVHEFCLQGPEVERGAPVKRIVPKMSSQQQSPMDPIQAWNDSEPSVKAIPEELRRSSSARTVDIADPDQRLASLGVEAELALANGQLDRVSEIQTQRLACMRIKYPKNNPNLLDAHLDLADTYMKRQMPHQARLLNLYNHQPTYFSFEGDTSTHTISF